MKKYRLKLKDEYKCTTFNIDGVMHNPEKYGQFHNYVWLKKMNFIIGEFVYSCVDINATLFSQVDIDRFSHGFTRMHDIIEVNEEFFYIRLANFEYPNCYLNEYVDGSIVIADWQQLGGYKAKFTKKEIEEKYPAYANNTFMIRVEDNE